MKSGEEVEIVCLGDTAYVPDLGLRLVRGARFKTTLSAASKSRDLETAKAQGIVGVKVMKAKIIRQESTPNLAGPSSTNHRSISRAQLPAIPTPVIPIPSSAGDAGVARALRELTQEIRGLREDLKANSAPSVPDIATAISFAVSEALRGVRFEGPGKVGIPASSVPGHDAPMFIPTGIVQAGPTPEIRTSTETTGDVNEAQEALRRARKGSRSRDDG